MKKLILVLFLMPMLVNAKCYIDIGIGGNIGNNEIYIARDYYAEPRDNPLASVEVECIKDKWIGTFNHTSSINQVDRGSNTAWLKYRALEW